MELKVKNLGISTGGVQIVVMNEHDARVASFHQGDRLLLETKRRCTVSVLDVTSNEKIVPRGTIGLFQEAHDSLRVRTGQYVYADLAAKPASIEYIQKKLHGESLSKKEMRTIVSDIVGHKLTDIEKTYFVSACFLRELSDDEVVSLTESMIETGEVFKLRKRPILDKHCIGGVAGNRTTAVVVPIIAAAGLTIPKTSSRSITSPAGTSDTIEVLANVCLSIPKMKKVVRKTGGCLVWGGSMNLAPADDKIIKIEHPISLDPVGQLLASILAKKKAVSATHVLIDIPLGKGAKIDDEEKAIMLKHRFETIGRKLKMHVKVVITDGSEPIGNGIGPALEAKDILWTLKDDARGSAMLRKKAISLAGLLLEMGKKARKGEGELLAEDLIRSGRAYQKFIAILRAQGAHITNAERIRVGKHTHDVVARRSGVVIHVSNEDISTVAKLAGAPKDKCAGIYLYHHNGEHVQKGDVLYRIYAENKVKLADAVKHTKKHSGIIIH